MNYGILNTSYPTDQWSLASYMQRQNVNAVSYTLFTNLFKPLLSVS